MSTFMQQKFTIATKIFLDDTKVRNILLGNWGKGAWQLLFGVNAGGAVAINLRKDVPNYDGSDPNADLVSLVGNVQIAAKKWQHVAVTFDWGKDQSLPSAILYVDGQVAGAVSVTPDSSMHKPYTLKPSTYRYLIGAKEDEDVANRGMFSGQIADFRVYMAALSAGEVAQLL
ncbi:MAG: hypothetical protein QM784_09595 [Polyangiaceae bacterium]